MAQHDYVIDNSTGANVRADINSVLQAIASNNSGSSAPSTTVATQFFADTNAGIMKLRNTSNNGFVNLFTLAGGIDVDAASNFNEDVTFTGASANIVFDKSDNALEFADNAKATFGTGGDCEIFHDASNSFIENNTGFLALRNSSSNSNTVFIRGKGDEDGIRVIGNGAVELYHDNSKKFETTSNGVSVSGTVDGTVFQSSRTSGVGLSFADNVQINLGTGDDLQIFHDPAFNHGFIKEIGSGGLIFGASVYEFYNADISEKMLTATADGAVELYHDNSKKAETYSAGLLITGTLSVDTGNIVGLDNAKLKLGTSDDLQIFHDGTNSRIKNTTGKLILSGDTIELCRQQDDSIGLRMIANAETVLSHAFFKRFETTTGGITVTGTVTETSDIAMKKDIEDLTYGLDIIKQLKPRKYKFTNEGNVDAVDIGFVAQEVETVIPEIVKGEEGSKGVSYGHFSSVLTKALQEAILKIETLETKVAALEAA